MKKTISLVSLALSAVGALLAFSSLTFSNTALAQTAPATIYMPVVRENDIFVFCKYGDPDYGGWQPLYSPAGTFTVTNYYYYIYGRGIYTSAQYMMVCPYGQGPGSWTPGSGDSTGENTAYSGTQAITYPH